MEDMESTTSVGLNMKLCEEICMGRGNKQKNRMCGFENEKMIGLRIM